MRKRKILFSPSHSHSYLVEGCRRLCGHRSTSHKQAPESSGVILDMLSICCHDLDRALPSVYDYVLYMYARIRESTIAQTESQYSQERITARITVTKNKDVY